MVLVPKEDRQPLDAFKWDGFLSAEEAEVLKKMLSKKGIEESILVDKKGESKDEEKEP